MEIVAALRDATLGVVADTYLGLAGAHAEAGEAEAAATAISQAAEAQVLRGSSQARLTIGKLREVLPAERQWQADALEARIGFPEDLAGSLEALRAAAEHARGDEEHLEHLANYCDLLAFASEFDAVLNVTADLTIVVQRTKQSFVFASIASTPWTLPIPTGEGPTGRAASST